MSGESELLACLGVTARTEPSPDGLTRAAGRDARANALLTASRMESKYLLSVADADVWAQRLDGHLERHREGQRGRGGHQYQTSVYLDTELRSLFADAHAQRPVVQVRVRAYDAPATKTEPLARAAVPTLWLELKSKAGARVDKRRFSLSPAAVARALSRLGGELVSSDDEGASVDASRPVAELDTLIESLGLREQRLRPDCIVNYRREAWQDADGALRVTLDTDVAFFAPGGELWPLRGGLRRALLGRPCAALPRAVLEIKSRGRLPRWLRDTLAGLVSVPFSKFVAASAAAHGHTSAPGHAHVRSAPHQEISQIG